MATAGNAVVMAGALRVNQDPSRGPFEPVIWRSEDLETWVPAELEGGGEGVVVNLAATGSGLLAVGRGSRNAAMWRSDDDGASWAIEPVPDSGDADGAALRDIAVGEGTVVAVGSTWGEEDSGTVAIFRSTDDGQFWVSEELDAAVVAGLGGGYSVDYVAGAFWIVSSRRFDAFEDVDRC